MKKILLFSTGLLLFCSSFSLAVIPPIEFIPYTWEEDRERTPLTEEQKELPEFIIYAGKHLQFEMGTQSAHVYSTSHFKIYLNSEEAIQSNNRIEISMINLIDIVDIRARTFTSDGRIIELDQESVREISDDEVPFARLFAIEGIDKGSEIEFFYTVKSGLSLFGSHALQQLAPCKKSEFSITVPFYLQFDLKPYNADLRVDTLEVADSLSHRFRVVAHDLPELRIEPFSNPLANVVSVHYRFVETILFPGLFKFDWDEAGRHFHELVYDKSRRETRALRRFWRGIEPEGSLEEKISAIENHLKNTIVFDQRAHARGAIDLNTIINNRSAGSIGMIRLFTASLDHFNIRHELVITSDRFGIPLDPYFESWYSLREYLIYFPQIKKFIAPDYYAFRNFLIPYGYTNTYGLFIRRQFIQGRSRPLAYPDWIPATDHKVSTDNLDIEVSFKEDMSGVNVRENRTFSGYNSLWIQPFADVIPEDELLEIVEELTKNTAPDAEILEWEMLNKGANLVNRYPLEVNVTYFSSAYLQRAGRNHLFKLGELIGPQLEMYVERERQLPVENDYLRGYDRKIRVYLPENVKVANPEDIAIKEYFAYEGEKVFFFESTYTIEDQVLEVRILEHYNKMEVGPEYFEDFRRVINAAADFNKVTLLLGN